MIFEIELPLIVLPKYPPNDIVPGKRLKSKIVLKLMRLYEISILWNISSSARSTNNLYNLWRWVSLTPWFVNTNRIKQIQDMFLHRKIFHSLKKTVIWNSLWISNSIEIIYWYLTWRLFQYEITIPSIKLFLLRALMHVSIHISISGVSFIRLHIPWPNRYDSVKNSDYKHHTVSENNALSVQNSRPVKKLL